MNPQTGTAAVSEEVRGAPRALRYVGATARFRHQVEGTAKADPAHHAELVELRSPGPHRARR
ncbi:hypothetical protein [Nocardia amamiensis]|uniref:hypothetical protein n=1 Tax=Nocardia amamiensis TaxID=404578 RepID=UPI00082AD4DB|nr:hypothetical protein [Nocardia amamiensis]